MFPEDNCGSASYVLRYFHEYLGETEGKDINVIYWNAGFWGCLRLFGEDLHTPVEVYAYYIERICIRIQMPLGLYKIPEYLLGWEKSQCIIYQN